MYELRDNLLNTGEVNNIAYNTITRAWEDPNGGNYPSAVSVATGETITFIGAGFSTAYAIFDNPYYFYE